MTEVFYEILNMSLKASYVILAVLIIRFLLKKAPKKYSYALWAAVAFRLVCPVSFQSVISLFALQFKRGDITHVDLTPVANPVINTIQPQANVGIPAVDTAINNSIPAPTPQYSANPMQIIMHIAMIVWLLGIAAMVIYSVVTYIRLHRKLRFAVKFEDNIWQADTVASPFIMGFVKPKIYIPFGLDAHKLDYVLQHEKAHIRRLDHIVKPLAFLILAVHWFNPLVWLSFYLMSRDMEMSCDEKVLSNEENSGKDYSNTLLSLASVRRMPVPSPLAFGESSIGKRIKNALSFKKPAVWISIIAVIICVAVIFVCSADPKEKEPQAEDIFGKAYATPEFVYTAGMYSYVPQTDDTANLYIDENGKVFNKGWYLEQGWGNIGNLWEIELTKENFDDYFNGSELDWEEGYSAEKIREENINAWKFEQNGNLYYILQQKDGEILNVAVMNHGGTYNVAVVGEGVGEEFCVRWIYRLEPAQTQAEYSLAGTSYVSYSCLYMSPLSSFAAVGGDSVYRYVIMNNEMSSYHAFVMINRASGDMQTLGEFGQWQEFPYTEEEWNDMFLMYPVDISGYEEKLWMPFEGRKGYALAKMDDQLWFVDTNGDEMWCIYSLVPESYMGMATWDYSEGDTLEIEFEIPGNMTAVCTQSDISADGESFDVEAAWTDGSIHWSPVDENGELVMRAQIHFASDRGYGGNIYINGSYSGEDLWYNVTTSGTGLHLKGKDEDTLLVHVIDGLVLETETEG